MIKAEEIVDSKTLERWLKEWPAAQELDEEEARKVAVTIAHRAALRVLPLAWEWFSSDEARRRDLTALPILRSVLISGVASACPTPGIKAAAAAAYAEAAAYAAAAARAAYAVDAARAAARAADAAAAAAAASASAAIFSEFQADALALEQGLTLQNAAIWVEASPGWFDEAQSAFKSKAAHEAPTWNFWLRWWGGAISGKPLPWDIQEKVALIPEKEWKKGPEHIAQLIVMIENVIGKNHHSDQSNSNPQTIERVRANIQSNRAALPPSIEAIQSLLVQEIERWQTSNELNARLPGECQRQIELHLAMFEALDQMKSRLPDDGLASDEEVEEIIGLAKLFTEKFKALPRDKADEVVASVWNVGGNACKVGLVLGTACLGAALGVPAMAGVLVGTAVFAPKNAGEIIKAAKELASKPNAPSA